MGCIGTKGWGGGGQGVVGTRAGEVNWVVGVKGCGWWGSRDGVMGGDGDQGVGVGVVRSRGRGGRIMGDGVKGLVGSREWGGELKEVGLVGSRGWGCMGSRDGVVGVQGGGLDKGSGGQGVGGRGHYVVGGQGSGVMGGGGVKGVW